MAIFVNLSKRKMLQELLSAGTSLTSDEVTQKAEQMWHRNGREPIMAYYYYWDSHGRTKELAVSALNNLYGYKD